MQIQNRCPRAIQANSSLAGTSVIESISYYLYDHILHDIITLTINPIQFANPFTSSYCVITLMLIQLRGTSAALLLFHQSATSLKGSQQADCNRSGVWAANQGRIVMSKFTLSLGLSVVLALVLSVANIEAAGKVGKLSSFSHRDSSHDSHKTFSHNSRSFQSHCYPSSYRGWSNYCWFSNYRCCGYYCPYQSCWYYWYPQQSCYLPCSYMSTFTPTPVNLNQNQNQNQNQNTNTNINIVGNSAVPSLPPLPPGASPLPSGVAPFIPPVQN
jgi:hypothetical protein